MNREDLIAYLDAVCDAESAVLACSSAISQVQGQLNSLKDPAMPVLNTHPLPKKATTAVEERGFHIYGIWAGIGIGYFISCFIPAVGLYTGLGGWFVAWAILSAIAIFVINMIVYASDKNDAERMQQKIEADYQARVAAVEASNVSLRKEHEWRMNAYQQHIQLLTASRQALSGNLAQFQSRLETANLKRAQIYAKGTIYAGFRNPVAVFTLREYLRMGICTELEGPNGAYSQYMLDVRTSRILSSIDDLRDAIVSSISQLQMALVTEIQETNRSIERLGESIYYNLNQLEQSLRLSQQQATAQVTMHLSQANEKLARIQAGTETIAINQYIANRMAGVDAYLA